MLVPVSVPGPGLGIDKNLNKVYNSIMTLCPERRVLQMAVTKKILALSVDQKLYDLIDEYAMLTDRPRSSVAEELFILGFGVVNQTWKEQQNRGGINGTS